MIKIVICIPIGSVDSRACVCVFKHHTIVAALRCINGLFSRLVLLGEFTDRPDDSGKFWTLVLNRCFSVEVWFSSRIGADWYMCLNAVSTAVVEAQRCPRCPQETGG